MSFVISTIWIVSIVTVVLSIALRDDHREFINRYAFSVGIALSVVAIIVNSVVDKNITFACYAIPIVFIYWSTYMLINKRVKGKKTAAERHFEAIELERRSQTRYS